jgi:hypothetical protein
MDNFGTSRTVHTVRHLKILNAMKDLHLNYYYLSLNERKIIKSKVDEVAEQVRSWLKDIIDLSELPYSYPVSGTHSSIEQWIASETRPIYCFKGEYPYLSHLRKINIIEMVEEIPTEAVVYMSNPFSSTGNYDDRYYSIKNPIILDIAYVGTTAKNTISLTANTEQVFWSASKPFGLGNFRAGYKFTRIKDSLQEQIKDTGYFNLVSIDVLSIAISSYSVTDLYEKFHNSYIDICVRNNLETSDSYLLASSKNPIHEYLKREDGNIRVPVGLILDQIYYINDKSS